MSECKEKGCRYLQTTCIACGRLVIEKILPKPQEWISVKNQTPQYGQDIIVYLAKYSDDILKVRTVIQYLGSFHPSATHWMPLPESPKSEGYTPYPGG